MWITPKTNWEPTDFITYVDYNRMVTNLNHIKGIFDTLYPPIYWRQLTTKAEGDDIYASDFNSITDMLNSLNVESVNTDIGNTQSYKANGYTIAYTDLNRIESGMLKLKTMLLSQYQTLPHLAIKLGDKTFNVGREEI